MVPGGVCRPGPREDPPGQTPPGKTRPGQSQPSPLGTDLPGRPPWVDISLGRHPPGQTPRGQTPPPGTSNERLVRILLFQEHLQSDY